MCFWFRINTENFFFNFLAASWTVIVNWYLYGQSEGGGYDVIAQPAGAGSHLPTGHVHTSLYEHARISVNYR